MEIKKLFKKSNPFLIISLIGLCVVCFSFKTLKNNTQIQSESLGYSETIVIKKGEAKLIYANIKLIAGELEISGGSRNLMDAEFIYEDDDLKPDVEYDDNPEIGNLTVELDRVDVDLVDEDNVKWDISLNNDVPIDLSVKLGAGEGRFNLGSLNLENFELTSGAGEYYIDLRNSSVPKIKFTAGAGEATIDLSGEHTNSLTADFTCGFGELTILLPENMGVKLTVTGLAGTINYPGFTKQGNEYKNDKFGETKNYIDLKITGGMGEINLKLVD
ncbi:MAG: hypothetical protein JXB17_06275 [Bacteroidales bacterium]|nr:hypothetical protein [Bacteroidales bacterium]